MELLTLDPIAAPERAEQVWRRLESEARPTFFLTWAWMGTWLGMLPREARVRLWIVREGGEDVAAFFVGERLVLRHRLLPSRALFLNQAGLPTDDALFLEHNAVLVRPSHTIDWPAVLQGLGTSWDEIFFSAVAPEHGPSVGDRGDYEVFEQRRTPSPCVDLARVRGSSAGYPALLAKGPRGQIARARRIYAERGEFGLEVAREPSFALAIFDELVELHRATWEERGESGAFASEHMLAFHRALIREHTASGGTQLVRVHAGGQTIGCLYSLVANGHVAFYQSGLRREQDNRLKPGLVCHAEAIAENARLGHRVYDFLGGTSRYKVDLATDATTLCWLRIARKRRRFWLEARARQARDHLRALRARYAVSGPKRPSE